MILMLSGTQDGRALGTAIAESGHRLIMTAVSEYGGERLPVHDNIEHKVGHLDQSEMVSLIKDRKVKILIDATHPYAVAASENAIAAAEEAGIAYLRYERPDLKAEADKGLVYIKSYEEAAQWLSQTQGHIFLTIGSRRLKPFVDVLASERLTARVLPVVSVLEQCAELGLKPNQIIAMQGPFSKEINLAMLKQFQSKYLVTKASSTVGGFEDKISAARELGMTVLVIERPDIVYPSVCHDINTCIKKLQSQVFIF